MKQSTFKRSYPTKIIRIDARTQIEVRADIPDEWAREDYLQKISKTKTMVVASKQSSRVNYFKDENTEDIPVVDLQEIFEEKSIEED